MIEHFLQEISVTETGKLIISAAITVERFLNGEIKTNNNSHNNSSNNSNTNTNKIIWSFLLRILRSPMTLLYYFYIWLPLFWFTLTLEYVILVIRVSVRRSPRLHILVKHLSAFYISAISLYHHIRNSQPIDIINWILQTCFEVIYTGINGTSVELEKNDDSYCADLILYEVFQDKNPLPPNYRKRMKRLMHYDVPTDPFFASVQLNTHSRGQTPLRTRANTDWSQAGSTTPGSLPPTPKSRAACLGKSTARVDDVLYTARDKLRLVVRKSHSDEFSKKSASKLLVKGKFGTFDPFHTAQNIRLSNGDHCAKKISTTNIRSSPLMDHTSVIPSPLTLKLNSISSTRSTIPIMKNVYVYIEYHIKANRSTSITSTSASTLTSKLESTPTSNTATLSLISNFNFLNNTNNTNNNTTTNNNVFPPLGQIDEQGVRPEKIIHSTPNPSPLPSPSVSPSKKINGSIPGIYLGIASCDFPLHNVPVGLADKSISISNNGLINISSNSILNIDDSEHGNSNNNIIITTNTTTNSHNSIKDNIIENHRDNFPENFEYGKSYPIQGYVSSGDHIGILIYLPSSLNGESDDFFTPRNDYETTLTLPPLHPQNQNQNQCKLQLQSSDSWSSLNISSYDSNQNINQMLTNTNDDQLQLQREFMNEAFEIKFNLNGYPIVLPWNAQSHLGELYLGDTSLYPTVSFLDEGMSVWSGFSVDDIVYRDRKSIGAPDDVVVYCLDGSVLLEKDD